MGGRARAVGRRTYDCISSEAVRVKSAWKPPPFSDRRTEDSNWAWNAYAHTSRAAARAWFSGLANQGLRESKSDLAGANADWHSQ